MRIVGRYRKRKSWVINYSRLSPIVVVVVVVSWRSTTKGGKIRTVSRQLYVRLLICSLAYSYSVTSHTSTKYSRFYTETESCRRRKQEIERERERERGLGMGAQRGCQGTKAESAAVCNGLVGVRNHYK